VRLQPLPCRHSTGCRSPWPGSLPLSGCGTAQQRLRARCCGPGLGLGYFAVASYWIHRGLLRASGRFRAGWSAWCWPGGGTRLLSRMAAWAAKKAAVRWPFPCCRWRRLVHAGNRLDRRRMACAGTSSRGFHGIRSAMSGRLPHHCYKALRVCRVYGLGTLSFSCWPLRRPVAGCGRGAGRRRADGSRRAAHHECSE